MAMLSHDEARAQILAQSTPLPAEQVPLAQTVGRVVCEESVAARDLPPFDNSAMDGYAVRGADIEGASEENPSVLGIINSIAAGDANSGIVTAGTAMRIFTGAVVPEGADTVVMQENTERRADQVLVKKSCPVGNNIRRAGEDITAGTSMLRPGSRVRAGDIGVLGAQGYGTLAVHRRPRVAIVPTGNELVPITHPLRPGQIPNSNAHMLAALVHDAGGTPKVFPPLQDTPDAVRQGLQKAAVDSDVMLTCGGVSVGEHDHVRAILGELGHIEFWKVAIKPGKPLVFAKVPDTLVLGLPGNPVSAFVCFELFARPLLRRLAGLVPTPPRPHGKLTLDVHPNRSRTSFLRGALERREDSLWATPFAHQGSGQLTSMLGADVLMEIPPGDSTIARGTPVALWPLHQHGFGPQD